MKKLLLILSAVFVSVSIRGAELDPNTGWDNLNPYAYDLKSEVINNGQTLRLTYKFNAPGFGNGDEYNQLNPKDGTGTGRGIQIYLLYKDADGNFQRVTKDNGEEYRIVTGGYNKAQEWSVEVNVSDIPNNCKGKELTWEARVHGNIGRTTPKVVKASGTKPTNAYGIAVNNDPTHVRFAQMFVSEAYPNKRGGWDKHGSGKVYENSNTMLEYNPLLNYVCAHHKHYHDGNTSHFASSWANGSVYSYTNSYNNEPNRVKISDDGRMFVSSFHPHASCAVVEYGRNRNSYDDAYKYYSVIKNSWGDNDNLNDINDNNNPFLYRRCIGMDVKGSGDNLKIILLWIDANGSTYKVGSAMKYCAKFEIWEYEVGRAEKEGELYLSPFDTSDGYVRKIGEYTDWDFTGADGGGAFYQGVIYGYNNMYRGFADLVYGTNNDVWVKIDYCFWRTSPGKIIRVKLDNGNATKYTLPTNTDASGNGGFYGGNAILVKDDLLFTSSTKNTIKAYQIDVNTGDLVLENSSLKEKYTITDSQIGEWVTGLTMDYAGNLYALARATENKEVCTLNVLGVAMPYKTKTAITTRARGTFVVNDPVPNILATDLRFAPDGNSDRYVFSFNVNTTPEVAQIRFYKSYGDNGDNDMKKNLAKINADNYQGEDSITPSFVYDIPTNQLKQGKISVSLGMCGGTIEDGKITNGKLPRGEWYWSVYVEAPRKSSVFAPIYRLVGQTHATEGYERKHATVNNYPETDGFGNIIVAHNPQNTTNDATRPEKGLRIYGISDSGNDEHAYTNTDRYSLRATYLNKNSTTGMLNYPRRMDVAPDGKVYIADEGSPTNDKDWKDVDNGPVVHVRGGVKVWDPAIPNNFTLFSNNKILTATSVALWDGKLYATNTYDEYVKHLNGKTNYTKDQQANTSQYGWNGFVQYDKVDEFYTTSNDGTWANFWSKNSRAQERALGRGDAAGNIALVAMDKGVWMCQHKEHNRAVKDATYQPLADNLDGYILSFVPYGSNTRTWRSCVENGVDNFDTPGSRTERADASDFSQKLNSPVQSTPGGGIAYKKVNGKEYLYVVNHDGNIAQLEITSWSGSGTTATPTIPIANIKILTTPTETKGTKEASAGGYSTTWTGAYITSMTFDYAGNLVTTTGKNYHDGPQDIIVYTMPYDRVNAREIQAPNSCRYIPERVSHMDMGNQELANIINYYLESNSECYVDIFRPMFNTAFNTICLPFDVDLRQATAGAYHNATLMQFDKAVVREVNNEKMLELQFTEKTDNNKIIEAGIPYLIKPENPIPGIMSLEQDIKFETINSTDQTRTFNNGDNSITFIGIIPYQFINVTNTQPLPLIVVDQNRLAEVSNGGNILGFRAYFQLEKELEPGTKAAISMRKPTPTDVITIDGKRVNIEKFLREGRVYIRVGDSLYTISGEKVE